MVEPQTTEDGSNREIMSLTEDDDKDDDAKERLHEVGARDTLCSIAALYQTTPSRLAQHNKLSSRFIFAGQTLKIPIEKSKKPVPTVSNSSIPEEPEIMDPQFIRLRVRHLTNGEGIVAGGILLTPRVFMFNPSPNDPLVQEEKEPDFYQVVSPIDLVVNVAILKDFPCFRIITEEIDKKDEELIYFPSEEIQEQVAGLEDLDECDKEDLMYLRLLMGKPINKRLPRTAPISSYGEQTLEAQYWFILSPKRAVAFYRYLRKTFPEKQYGAVRVNGIESAGYELLREGVPVIEEEAGRTCNRETVAKAFRKTVTMTSMDLANISTVIGDTELMEFSDRLQLARAMPPRTDGLDWVLKFSTSRDGFNLKSLLRKVKDVNGPVLILVSDCEGAVFGTFMSEAPQMSEHFQGTGETFVFTLRPDFRLFNWSGENMYFYKVDANCLIVGSGDGNFALWLDSDLNQGRTQACSTFDSAPLTSEDFVVKTLECWAFEMS